MHLEDSVEITGSRMVMGGLNVVIAESVRHAHSVLALRRMSGEPYWYAFRNKSYAGASAPATVAQDTNPPVQQEQQQQQQGYQGWNQWSQFGPSTIYGSAWSITPPGALQGGGMGRPGINSVIILGNPYFSGPSWWRY